MAARNLLSNIRSELQAVADPARAPQMQAYMKSTMPFHGVPTPVRRKLLRKVFAQWDISEFKQWESLALEVWRGARFREERYAALELLCDRRAREHHSPRAMRLFEEMIVDGAWWDYVDELASNHVGIVLRDYPVKLKPLMRKWSRSSDMWKRRTSIISQLTFGPDTDLALLYDCIEPSIDSKEFFLRKAIGWALRQYAWDNPKEVIRYVSREKDRLSSLSQREALKNIAKSQA